MIKKTLNKNTPKFNAAIWAKNRSKELRTKILTAYVPAKNCSHFYLLLTVSEWPNMIIYLGEI
ncbi:MAG: hypothetical protein BGO78_03815 [Chloroflexi bacterium 44-23]|nr:MAG: hypothetical protein BGO78_03815 [Chloroflexi bacterium 44-23]